MQLNWGHKLAIFIGLFVVGMLSMVMFAARQDNEMIDDNYYQKELEYQSVIDAQENLMRISADNIVSQDMDEVIITLPIGTFEKLESGHIELLRREDSRRDVGLDIEPNGSNRRTILKDQLLPGMYRARIRWVSGGKPYYREESIYVEKQL